MKRPTILLDCDGVLADFTSAFLRHVHPSLTPDDVTDYRFASIAATHSLDAAWQAAHVAGFCTTLTVLPGAAEGVRALQEVADVVIVTSPMPSPTWAHERTEWLRRHFGIAREAVIHASAKHHVVGDVLVDDVPEHIKAWEAAHGRTGVLWAAPHNRGHERRVACWDAVRRMVPR